MTKLRKAHPMQRFGIRLVGWALTTLGAVCVLGGLWSAGTYVWGAIAVLGEADQSFQFWGLVLLLIGLGVLVLGIALIAAGRALRRRS